MLYLMRLLGLDEAAVAELVEALVHFIFTGLACNYSKRFHKNSRLSLQE